MAEDDLLPVVQELKEQQKELMAQQRQLMEQMEAGRGTAFGLRKDLWDRLGAIAPILSGAIIAMGGAYFTTIYNQQQLKLQEIQTIEKFIPHLVGDERSKRAAILAISSLTDAKLAAKVAAIYASEGTVSALESIAEHGSSGDRKIANVALPGALDNMAENYRVERRYEDAINTYKKALIIRQSNYGDQSPRLVPSLSRLANIYISHAEYAEAEALLQRAISIQKSNYGYESVQVASALRSLAELYRVQGTLSKCESVLNQAIAIEQNLPATAGGAKLQTANMSEDDALREDERAGVVDNRDLLHSEPRTEIHGLAADAANHPSGSDQSAKTAGAEHRLQPDGQKTVESQDTNKFRGGNDGGQSADANSGGEQARGQEPKGKTI